MPLMEPPSLAPKASPRVGAPTAKALRVAAPPSTTETVNGGLLRRSPSGQGEGREAPSRTTLGPENTVSYLTGQNGPQTPCSKLH